MYDEFALVDQIHEFKKEQQLFETKQRKKQMTDAKDCASLQNFEVIDLQSPKHDGPR